LTLLPFWIVNLLSLGIASNTSTSQYFYNITTIFYIHKIQNICLLKKDIESKFYSISTQNFWVSSLKIILLYSLELSIVTSQNQYFPEIIPFIVYFLIKVPCIELLPRQIISLKRNNYLLLFMWDYKNRDLISNRYCNIQSFDILCIFVLVSVQILKIGTTIFYLLVKL